MRSGWQRSAIFSTQRMRCLLAVHATKGHDGHYVQQRHGGVSPAMEVCASFRGRVAEADAKQRGEVWLTVTADFDGPQPVSAVLRIPLASTEDAYGESRSCTTKADGSRELVYTAGLDEANFVRFAASDEQHPFRLLLNKYLCRLLAAPFHCGGEVVALKPEWAHWKLAREFGFELSSDAASTFASTELLLVDTIVPFDFARCAVVAPSNGYCCVGGKTTEWHCGGTPVGVGWHQVSGECFHRETGGSCAE